MEGNPVTSLWQVPAVVVMVLGWLATPPASLGEVAQREALRRSLTPKSTGALTNLGLPEEPPPAAVSTPPVEPPPVKEPPEETEPPPAVAAGAAAAAPAAAPPAASQRRDEKYWRDRITEARAALDQDQVLAEAMQSRINALQTDVVNRDDPAQQAQLRQQLARALAELDRLSKQIDADKKAITNIEQEARRLGVPPGWLR